jgi:carbamoyltransferase
MKIVGVNTGHDGGCALLEDGKLKVAISEERIIRSKCASGWLNSLFYCLENSNSSLDDIDLVVFSSYRTRLEEGYDGGLSKFNFPKERCISVDHHLSHACATFFSSPFNKSLIFVYDNHGNESDTESFYLGEGNKIHKIGGNPFNDVLKGIVRAYEAFTCYFGWNSDGAGKTMGLASYGDKKRFEKYPIYDQTKEGWYYSNLDSFYIEGVEKLLKKYGINQFSKYSMDPMEYKDLAAWIQNEFERAVLGTIDKLHESTGLDTLCISGGGALNSVCNGKILEKTKIKNLFVFPAASDKGQCVGNALYGQYLYERQNRKDYIWKTDYTGQSYDSASIRKLIDPENRAFRENNISKAPRYEFKVMKNVVDEVAKLISEGKIVGWFQGGSELGPRALGHRSIICDPRRPEMKDILNEKVKHREGFRPFAPSILLEKSKEYFSLDVPSPFMLLAVDVNKDKKSIIPAVTHVDGTARVQTVTKEDNGIYYDLINEFYRITGVPVILNTSFNLAGEPIVETPEDAMMCFLKTQMDFLVIGDFLIWKVQA